MFNLLFATSFIHIITFLVALRQVRSGSKKAKFIYSWAFPYSAFVWEDLLVFSFFYYLTTMITIFSHDLRIGALFMLVFWVVRSAGETLYFFLQQFHQPKHHPHAIGRHFIIFEFILNIRTAQKSFILMQIFHQTILTISIVLLSLLLLNWHSLLWTF